MRRGGVEGASSGVTREQVLLQVRLGGVVMSGIFDFLVVNAFPVVFSGNPDFGARGFSNIRPGLRRMMRPSGSGLYCKCTGVDFFFSEARHTAHNCQPPSASVYGRRRVCAHTQTHPTFSCGKELGAGGAVSVYVHVYATT